MVSMKLHEKLVGKRHCTQPGAHICRRGIPKLETANFGHEKAEIVILAVTCLSFWTRHRFGLRSIC